MTPYLKVAFLTEMGFSGKVHRTHSNMRTEFSWMASLSADHYNISNFNAVSGYSVVFVIIPKGKLNLSAEGLKIANNPNPVSNLLVTDFIGSLKQRNAKVYVIQEGPHWWWNDYSVKDQILFYNALHDCDGIFAHNESDVAYYAGLFPGKMIRVIRSLMIEDLISPSWKRVEDKVLIGGNFARWYGGFHSYIIGSIFDMPMWVQDSHCKQEGEEYIDNINHFNRLVWVDWMREVAKFKYAVHLMPTVAAGTFALNCAYFGIPCIGNIKVDTQRLLFPELSVDVDDLQSARELAIKLKSDVEFYEHCSSNAKKLYEIHYKESIWLENMLNLLTN